MNPFDLRGPEFLVLYLVFGTAVLVLLHWMVRSGGPDGAAGNWHLEDPYEIAYLRAGGSEALRVAMVALMDRGVLKASGDQVVAGPQAESFVQRPIEREIVGYFKTPRKAVDVFAALGTGAACERYRESLAARGLLPGVEVRMRRAGLAMTAVLVLVGVSAIKIAVAFARGRHNILFLVLLTVVFVVLAMLSAAATRTAAGNTLVRELKTRFASLRARASQLHPGGATNELSYLMAAYGLGVLPQAEFPYVKQLFPRASSSDGGVFPGGCGSSGCGGGGGGGGGGCGGGGCGGCGG